jgi:predicted anti-sigma-YlaC factor YlaD
MNCKRAQRQMSAYLDREVPNREALRFETHLAGCPACQARADRLGRVWHLLGAAEEIQPSPQFQARVRQAINAAPGRRQAPLVARLGWALALVAVLGLGTALGRQLALLPTSARSAPPLLATAGPMTAFQETPQNSLSAAFTLHLARDGDG